MARIPIPASSCQIRISNALSCVLMLCNSGHAMAPRHSHVILKYSWFGMGIWGFVFFVLFSLHQNRSRTHAAHKVGGLLLICGYMRVAQTGRHCPSHQKWIVTWIRCTFYKSIATLSFEPQPWFISPPNLPVKDLEGPTPKAFPEYLPAHFDRAPVGVDPSCYWIFDEAVSMKFV